MNHVQHIAQGRRVQRGYNADPLREAREFLFSFRIEEPFNLQLGFEFFKLHLQRSHALQFHRAHDELILAALLVHREVALQHHLLAVLHQLTLPHARAAKKHTRQLRTSVLDGKIHMPRSLRAKVGDFALHPNLANLIFQSALHARG